MLPLTAKRRAWSKWGMSNILGEKLWILCLKQCQSLISSIQACTKGGNKGSPLLNYFCLKAKLLRTLPPCSSTKTVARAASFLGLYVPIEWQHESPRWAWWVTSHLIFHWGQLGTRLWPKLLWNHSQFRPGKNDSWSLGLLDQNITYEPSVGLITEFRKTEGPTVNLSQMVIEKFWNFRVYIQLQTYDARIVEGKA